MTNEEILAEEIEAARLRARERVAAVEAEAARLERAKGDVELLTPREFDRHLRERYGVGSAAIVTRPPPVKLGADASQDSPAAFEARVRAIVDAGANPEVPAPRVVDATRLDPREWVEHMAALGVAVPPPSPHAIASWEREEGLRRSRESATREVELVAGMRALAAEVAKLQVPPPAPAPPPTELEKARAAYYRRAKSSRGYGVEGA